MLPGRWYLLLLFLVVIFLFALIQVGVISLAFEKLGLSPAAALFLVIASLSGSLINIPVYRIARSDSEPGLREPVEPSLPGFPRVEYPGRVVIAVNLGGCIIPLGISAYLFRQLPLSPLTTLTAVMIVTALSYKFSRFIPGVGIGMPLLLAPLVSAATALLLEPVHSAPVAYISGTLGVLIGADLLHLREVGRLKVAVASVGGAGTFDGIFLTGIVAALLA